ncbi:MAG: hypothetical protein LBT71_09065, partial [Azoarcus sp.]|nr:hypothetical protein [Azoarcus sp.]
LGLFSSALEHSFSLLNEAGFAVEDARRAVKYVCMAIGAAWSLSIARQIIAGWDEGHWRHAALCLFAALVAALGAAYTVMLELHA